MDNDTGDGRKFAEAPHTEDFIGRSAPLERPRLLVRARDYRTDLLYCGLIPFAVGFVVVSTLSCLFFYKEQLERLERQAPT